MCNLPMFVHEQSQPPWVPSPRRLESCSYKDNEAEVRVTLLTRAEEDSLAPFGVGEEAHGHMKSKVRRTILRFFMNGQTYCGGHYIVTGAQLAAFFGQASVIAAYYNFRIFNSWVEAFEVKNENGGDYTVTLTGGPFNDAHRCADWLLTVPPLLIELILVMRLPAEQTKRLSWSLGLASALMVALGHPGEIQGNLLVRWFWWALAVVPLSFVVLQLRVGLLVSSARYSTVVSWFTWPLVYNINNVDLAGPVTVGAPRLRCA